MAALVSLGLGSLASRGAAASSWQSFSRVQATRQRQPVSLAVKCAAVVQTEVLTEGPSKVEHGAWMTFVERVSGEWDGYGADFTPTGEPLELPSSVVPDAFRDWGVEIHDWQTMCPTLAHEEIDRSFTYRVIRLLPTVGCEADAATPYCIEERDLETAESYAFHANGSYTAVWPGKGVTKNNPEPGRTGKIVIRDLDCKDHWEIEHCLVKEGASTRSRARILQQFKIEENTNLLKLKHMTMYLEEWEGPFRNGESLGGCSTSGSSFATTDRLQSAHLAGSWHVESFFAEGEESSRKQLLSQRSADVERADACGIVPLPKNLWSTVKASENLSYYTIEAGWLVTPDQTIVSTCEYLPTGQFQVSNIRFEQRS